MYANQSNRFLSAIEQQAYHEGLKAPITAENPYCQTKTPHAARAWAKGNQLSFRLNARLGVQYLNASQL